MEECSNTRLELKIKESFENLFQLASFDCLTFFLDLESCWDASGRSLLSKKITQHNGKISLIPNTNDRNQIIVIPNKNELQISQEQFQLQPFSNSSKQNNSTIKSRRIKQLMGSVPQLEYKDSKCSLKYDIETYLSNPLLRIIQIKELLTLIKYFDSATIEWHLTRGLPSKFEFAKDLIVITWNEVQGKKQEYHSFGFSSSHMKINTHRLCVDSPMGMNVFLTEDQYKHFLSQRKELEKRYYTKIYNHKGSIKEGKKDASKKPLFCSICSVHYKQLEEHLKSQEHIYRVRKCEAIYKIIDSAFEEIGSADITYLNFDSLQESTSATCSSFSETLTPNFFVNSAGQENIARNCQFQKCVFSVLGNKPKVKRKASKMEVFGQYCAKRSKIATQKSRKASTTIVQLNPLTKRRMAHKASPENKRVFKFRVKFH